MTQDVVWAVSIVLMGSLAAVFAWVALGARAEIVNYGRVAASFYRLRTWLFVLAVLVLFGANYRTLGELPYVSSLAQSSDTAVKRVEVVGEQWDWKIKPDHFVVGQTAEFFVTSKDVNHGFAIYNPRMEIVAQTQAMPGYTNVLRYTFTKPGTYQVLCLEYCGFGNTIMKSEITVADH
ncbi:MAG: cytochrome C oxidase subunit II [Terriglobia bacterium]